MECSLFCFFNMMKETGYFMQKSCLVKLYVHSELPWQPCQRKRKKSYSFFPVQKHHHILEILYCSITGTYTMKVRCSDSRETHTACHCKPSLISSHKAASMKRKPAEIQSMISAWLPGIQMKSRTLETVLKKKKCNLSQTHTCAGRQR